MAPSSGNTMPLLSRPVGGPAPASAPAAPAAAPAAAAEAAAEAPAEAPQAPGGGGGGGIHVAAVKPLQDELKELREAREKEEQERQSAYSNIKDPGINVDDRQDPMAFSYREQEYKKKNVLQSMEKDVDKDTRPLNVNAGQGANTEKWKFQGPYDYPIETDNPGYFELQGLYQKAGPKALTQGLRHTSHWVNKKTKTGQDTKREGHYSYNHEKQRWKTLQRNDRLKYTRKRSKNERLGLERQLVGSASKFTLADIGELGGWRGKAAKKVDANLLVPRVGDEFNKIK